MTSRLQLHRSAREIFDHALAAVDPHKAVQRSVNLEGPILHLCGRQLSISSRNVYVIALGKAATSMALGLDTVIGEKITAGVISGPSMSGQSFSKRWRIFMGGHPLPNQASLDAARCAFSLLEQANAERAIVIFLVSGGGSAMIEWPVTEEITLEDLRQANRELVACGAQIGEINSVRRAFSAVKGGGLAKRAPQAKVITLIVSDTNRGDEASVASGPTLPPPKEGPSAIEVIKRYHLDSLLPASIMSAVKQTGMVLPAEQPAECSAHVLLDNFTALEAAGAKALDFAFAYAIPNGICEQPIQDGCDLLLSRFLESSRTNEESGFCLISGGEFSCPVRGDGRGGRNLETVLRCAIGFDQNKNRSRHHMVVLSAGTDGIDGNTPAAGAIADETMIDRARELGLDPNEFLARSDSYGFFERLNDLVITGPTGTNVRDVRILLRGRSV